MSKLLIAIVGVIYACIAAESLWKQDHMTAIVFAGYALANVGLYGLAA